MVIGITMEMNSTAFSKACSTVTFRQQKTYLINVTFSQNLEQEKWLPQMIQKIAINLTRQVTGCGFRNWNKLYFLTSQLYFQKFQLNVIDWRDTTSIWASHLTRVEGPTKKGKPKFQCLSHGIKNGDIRDQIDQEPIRWKKLSPSEQASITEKLKPLKWLLQK